MKLKDYVRFLWPDYSSRYRVVRVAILALLVLSFPIGWLLPVEPSALTWTRLILASFSIGCDVEFFIHQYRTDKRRRKEQLKELEAEIEQWRAEALGDLETKKEQP